MGQSQGDGDDPGTATGIGPLPAGPAPTTVSTPAAPRRGGRRGRLLVTALVLLVVLGGGVAGAVLVFGDFHRTRVFRTTAEKLFNSLDDREGAEKVYESASFRFKETTLVDTFLDMVERMNGTLGGFRKVTDVKKVERSSSVAGATARVELDLEFEKATTTAELSLLRDEHGTWQLLGLSVQIPPGLQATADKLERKDTRLRAPGQVIQLVHTILEGVRQGHAAEVHQSASPAFQGSVSAEEFENLLEAHREELGRFVRVQAILASAQNADKDRAWVQALLEYEKVKTTATFEFMRVEGEWRLLSFKVVIPPPLLPPEVGPPAPAAPDAAPD